MFTKKEGNQCFWGSGSGTGSGPGSGTGSRTGTAEPFKIRNRLEPEPVEPKRIWNRLEPEPVEPLKGGTEWNRNRQIFENFYKKYTKNSIFGL